MNTATLKISVIVPIYNVEAYLTQCLNSIVGQTYPHLEIICINDGSTDASLRILQDFKKDDERITIIDRENAGYGSGVNVGLDHASGDYISIIEPDDYIDVNMYEKMIAAAHKHKLPDIVKVPYLRVRNAASSNESIVPCYYFSKLSYVDTVFTIEDDPEFLFHHPSIWSALYKKSFLDEHHIRMMEVPGSGWVDNPFLYDTLLKAQSIVYLDEPLYYYREFDESLSGGQKQAEIIFERWLQMDDILTQENISSPGIVEAHLNRGCAHIEMLQHDFNPKDSVVKHGIDRMIERMDSRVIFDSSRILDNYKAAYKKALGFKGRLYSHLKR